MWTPKFMFRVPTRGTMKENPDSCEASPLARMSVQPAAPKPGTLQSHHSSACSAVGVPRPAVESLSCS